MLTVEMRVRELVWLENFDGEAGSGPDLATWSAELGAGGWGCDQLQTYTDDQANAHITAEGHLAITATQVPGDSNGVITSARLITKDHFTVTYGLVEARIKVPGGLGTWPAFWMLGSDIDDVDWPACGEIDVMEHVGSDPGSVHGTVHAPGYSGLDGGIGQAHRTGSDLSDDYHVYGVEWTSEQISWLFDGYPSHRVTPHLVPGGRWPFDHPFYLLVNLAIGGAWPRAMAPRRRPCLRRCWSTGYA